MSQITDSGYRLPVITALRGGETLGTGRTQPMIVTGVNNSTGEKGDYVVKFRASPEMSIEASVRELLGAFIGKQLNLAVVEPVLVDVLPAFVETLKGGSQYKSAMDSIGLNYASLYLGGKVNFTRGQVLSEQLLGEAARLFAFDVFISNADRRDGKPNMFTDGEKIYLFDHEVAFGFVYDLFPNPEPWRIRSQELMWIQKHYFYSYLRGHPVSLTTFIESFGQVDEAFWHQAAILIPAAWMNNQFHTIKEYLNQIVVNRVVFQQEIERILL